MAEQTLIEQVVQTCEQYNLLPQGKPLVVGVSGGVDSLVLLHALLELRSTYGLMLHVATLDHSLRGEAGIADADSVHHTAERWGLPCSRATADVPAIAEAYGLNIEEAARQARYTFLMAVAAAQQTDTVAVAHNYDDQAETVLMHIVRGTGLRGLRGMMPLTPLSDTHFLEDAEEFIDGLPTSFNLLPEEFSLSRPLLDVPRTMIRAYAEEHGLEPREDVTNADTTRFRSRIRHEILPLVENLNPNIRNALNRLADVVRADVDVIESRLESVAAWILDWHETEPDEDGEKGDIVFIDRADFRSQPLGIQRGLIRKAIYELSPGLRDISFEQTEKVRDLIINGATNTRIHLPADLTLSIGYDEAGIGYGGKPRYPAHLPSLEPGQYVGIDPEGQGYITGNMRLFTYWVVAGHSTELWHDDPLECTLTIPEGAKLALRTRQPGDRFRPFGMAGKSQKLSDTFTNLKVPSYLRDQVPLLTVNEEIAWFVAPTASGPQGRIADSFAVRSEHESLLRLRWQIES